MLAASTFKNEREREKMDGLSSSMEEREFGDENLVDVIDFDDLLLDDVLPHLEMDHPFFADEFESDNNSPANSHETAPASLSDPNPGPEPIPEPEPEPEPAVGKEADSSKKSPARCKNQPGKKKAKVDWTPELHRRFVQAVEELGIDKAVPSRIREIMGIHCLTRHNIASHLQKYRSHRKHVQAREAEAASWSWSRRRQIYGAAEANPAWIAPTLGFPPATPIPHFRPLHVWGHPSVDQSLMYTWPKHVVPQPPPPHSWPAPPLADPSFWHPNHQYVPPPGTPFFPPPQFQPTVRVPPSPATAMSAAKKLALPPSDVHPSKETLDAAIGDVLTKPWLPLPLGLKPPLTDVVMVELRRQGVSTVPPPN